MTWHQRFRQWI